LTAAKIFLLSNDVKLKIRFEEAVEFVNNMAQGKIDYQQTLVWLKEHAVK